MKYLFGPVNSRRLGISLGIDLVTHKTCTLNCIYCECGRTTCLTIERKEYVSTDEVLKEIDSFLSQNPELDYVTFSGSGEPTLHSGIGTVISYIKDNYPEYNIAVLTNGTLLADSIVRHDLLKADLVIPSLDGASEEVFTKIVRPAPGITAESTIKGLSQFRNDFKGKIILEIFIVPGLNDTPEELELLREACKKISPDTIELNSLDRPGTEENIEKAKREKLERIAMYFSSFKVRIIGKPAVTAKTYKTTGNMQDRVLSTLKRRPSTVEDLVQTLGIRHTEASKILRELEVQEKIISFKQERGTFYRAVE